tara:strand:- start:3020 stop:6388 length:3369 start_codon:yes stop_codon:yes gene_type:complete
MANKKLSSTQAYNEAIKPFIDHKNAYQEYKGTTTEGGIPRKESQEKIEAGQKWQKEWLVDPLTAVPSALWNLGFKDTGWEAGKNNWLLQSKADKAQRKDELNNFKIYRQKRDDVRNMILEMAEAGKEKYEKTGDEKYLNLVTQGVSDMLNSSGLQYKDFVTVDPEVFDMRDGSMLFSNQPNPYPILEAYGYIGAGTYGAIKGEKLMSNKFLKTGYGKKYPKGKLGYLARIGGAVLGGASGAAVSDYGYEGMLDIMNRAGQAKKWREDPNIRTGLMDTMLAEVMPESWTFGGEGINRPDQKARMESALSAFKWDAAISSAFFGARPLYYALRKGVGSVPFRMFKDKPSKAPGIVSSNELLTMEQNLLKNWAPKEGLYKMPTEKMVFSNPLGIPKLGEAIWKASNSRAFRWLGGPGPIKKGSNEWWPEPVEEMGTMLARTMVGGTIGKGAAATFSPTPLLGSGIRDNMAKQSDFYIEGVMNKMLGTFAPYANTVDMAIDWQKLASANARGFKAHAKFLEKEFTNAAEGMGKGFSDENLVSVAKQTLKEYREKLQVEGAEYGGKQLIPQEVSNRLIRFLENQIIKPVGEGRTHTMRDVMQMKGLREQMDDLLKPLQDQTLANTTYADDITRLFKAWDADVGSVSKMGYPEVSKAFQDYDNFVSKGLLLWGTDVGQSAVKVGQRGFNITLDTSSTRAGQGLFEVAVAAAKNTPKRAYEELASIKRIVGDRAYHNGVGTYIRNAFHKSLAETDQGMMNFDANAFRAALGLGEEGAALRAFMREALPGPEVTKLKIFNPRTGKWNHFDDELYAAGRNQGLKEMIGEEIPEGMLRAEKTKLPTVKEFEDLITILERLYKQGVPSTSKYMMRRGIMGGVRGALRSLSPTTAIGAVGTGALGVWPMIGLTWLANYGGRVLTNPVAMKVFKNSLDANLPETIRLANIARIYRMFPEEFTAFDADLAEMEQQQRIYDRSGRLQAQGASVGEKVKDAIIENIPSVEDLKSIPGNIIDSPYNPNLLQQMRKPDVPPGGVDAPYADEAGAYDTSQAGSSIMNSQTMNPSAAQALYTGNTDAALAAQYGGSTQYAAGGGLMELNPVMNNQGKYVDPQKGINDNPFAQSQNKGILGVL